jgi:nucleoid DNA-binding protein/DNA-directed RNA polymerase subunit RPC12/RpoP
MAWQREGGNVAKSLQKAGLIAEISSVTGIEKKSVGDVLDKLTEIAYREAPNGFIVPGICKLTVVKRKASRCRNPATGQLLMIGERQVLKIAPLKKAKDMIVPKPADLVQVLAEEPPPAPKPPPEPKSEIAPKPVSEEPAPKSATISEGAAAKPAPVSEAAAPKAEPVPKPEPGPVGSTQPVTAIPPLPGAEPLPSVVPSPDAEDGQIVFVCSSCGSMLAATPQNAGMQGECPFCGAKTTIPSRERESAGGKGEAAAQTDKAEGSADAGKQQPPPPSLADFITFVCQECGQEIEAPVDMIGLEVSCPTCASPLHVPPSSTAPAKPPEEESWIEKPETPAAPPGRNLSSMTIRLDLSDLE